MYNVPYIVGFVVGVAPLCVMVLSPPLGYLVRCFSNYKFGQFCYFTEMCYDVLQLPHLGVNFMQLAGLFLAAGSLILFGQVMHTASYTLTHSCVG